MGFPMCVPTFGNLRITGYVRLPEAYRSLSRPSSAPDAKAFTMRLCSLTFTRLLYLITSSTVKSIHSRTQVLFISYLSCFLVLSYIKLRNLSVKNFQSFAFNIFATTLNYFRVVSSNYQIKIWILT